MTKVSPNTSSWIAMILVQASIVVQIKMVKKAEPILSKLVIPKLSSSISVSTQRFGSLKGYLVPSSLKTSNHDLQNDPSGH